MEQQAEQYLSKKYECRNCGSYLVLLEGKSIETMTCPCGKKLWVLVETNYSDEQWEMVVQRLKGVYNEILSVLRTYMDMNEESYHIVTLWIIGTYVYEDFETFPLLFINATKGSGKTRLLKLLEALCFKGKIQANLSEAVLFRVKKLHTILIDEFEQAGNKEKGTLREIINASYKRGAKVERMKETMKEGKKEWVIEPFDLYSPLAMANIWGMDDVVEDRCITIRLDRSDDKLRSKLMEDFTENPQITSVVTTLCKEKCRLCRVVSGKRTGTTWNSYLFNKIKTTHTTLTTQTTQTTQTTLTEKEIAIFDKIDKIGVYGRPLELFFPLIMIADFFGEDLLEKTLEIAKKSFEEKNKEEFSDNPDISLLDFLWKSYNDRGMDYVKLSEMLVAYKFENSVTPDFDIRSLGRMLQRLNVILDKKRDSSGRKVMLDLAKIKQKLERYGK